MKMLIFADFVARAGQTRYRMVTLSVCDRYQPVTDAQGPVIFSGWSKPGHISARSLQQTDPSLFFQSKKQQSENRKNMAHVEQILR
ncbi:hypothetical protein [Desulforhopalus singaporensis]|uniref:Uncharacterized protein n=1 Tax=Desulforhopalus singaporensis TaxID=91360 RepID=A0A1H0TH16_9BACT|nr:hypothetical protein [Desulforhopalus singaporensis]SDP53289.1 hypothetical protein SAMN05660330_03091 [Desulforhopalus singaporensis]